MVLVVEMFVCYLITNLAEQNNFQNPNLSFLNDLYCGSILPMFLTLGLSNQLDLGDEP